jgi:23S rRNA (adenine-N6)-dimethyltransferase
VPGAGRQRWGWHQLVAPAARRLVDGAAICPGDLVVDIGAGTGALTAPLVAAGARVVAVELHPGRAQVLRERVAGEPVTVVRTDATDLRLPRRPFRVVANPPFATTTAVVKRLLGPGSLLVTADLVVPRGVARRWTGPGAPGAGRWQRTFSARIAATVPGSAFRPRPPGATVVLRIERRA